MTPDKIALIFYMLGSLSFSRRQHCDVVQMTAAALSEKFSPATGHTEVVDFDAFSEGWAFVDSGEVWRAHYFRVDRADDPPFFGKGGRVKFFKAPCGTKAAMTRRTPLLEAGKALRCLRCRAAVAVLQP